ncbi:helix-turn-helix domain-containing protein [Paenibacillus sp. 2KB_20]|uniref:helix-turn-helix domain-containing protein n=1 Tax=Paenibacillus sp. 2KB_20 TaxID=3232977 RepID=UPI003F9D5105
MPAFKGQKFKQYSFETKMEAIHLHLVEGWTYRRIMEKFGMTDRHRLKDWMKKYKESGEFGLMEFTATGRSSCSCFRIMAFG